MGKKTTKKKRMRFEWEIDNHKGKERWEEEAQFYFRTERGKKEESGFESLKEYEDCERRNKKRPTWQTHTYSTI